MLVRSEVDQCKRLLVDKLLDLIAAQLIQVGARQRMYICSVPLSTIFNLFALCNLEANRSHLAVGEDDLNWERVWILLPCQVWI